MAKLQPAVRRRLLLAVFIQHAHFPSDFAHQIAALNDGEPLTETAFEAAKVQLIGMVLGGVAVPQRPASPVTYVAAAGT